MHDNDFLKFIVFILYSPKILNFPSGLALAIIKAKGSDGGYFDSVHLSHLLGKSQWLVLELRHSSKKKTLTYLTATGSYRSFTCFP